MSTIAPNAAATTEDFEFAALNEARNYRDALVEEFASALEGDVIEIGAGIGHVTGPLRKLPRIENLLSIEPSPAFAIRFREAHPDAALIEGTIEQVPHGTDWNGVLSINVLEHIEDDEAELERYAKLLSARHGSLCLFVPARPEIYAPIDSDFGHFRRYTRRELRQKLDAAGFSVERLTYYNWLGYFAWWLNFRVLKKRKFEAAKVRAFDRMVFPFVHTMETSVLRPPFGQSLLAVARAR